MQNDNIFNYYYTIWCAEYFYYTVKNQNNTDYYFFINYSGRFCDKYVDIYNATYSNLFKNITQIYNVLDFFTTPQSCVINIIDLKN